MKNKSTIKFSQFAAKILFALASFVFTAVVFANSYELLANKDIPLGFSLNPMEIQEPINKTISEFAVKPNSQFLNSNAKLGPLDTLDIPSLAIRLQLEEARKIEDLWYERPSLGEYVELNKDKYNNAIDYLVYTTASWRTIPDPEELEVGAEVTLTTKSGLATTFTVSSRELLSSSSSLIVGKSERRQLILMLEDTETSNYYGYSLVAL